ncbi:MAG TPA: hypothetical protein VLF67_04280, partial [Candidatus Saccharimonas sp.]|nr:hypothetical protein [Candidatus Saccharimonas sp.]
MLNSANPKPGAADRPAAAAAALPVPTGKEVAVDEPRLPEPAAGAGGDKPPTDITPPPRGAAEPPEPPDNSSQPASGPDADTPGTPPAEAGQPTPADIQPRPRADRVDRGEDIQFYGGARAITADHRLMLRELPACYRQLIADVQAVYTQEDHYSYRATTNTDQPLVVGPVPNFLPAYDGALFHERRMEARASVSLEIARTTSAVVRAGEAFSAELVATVAVHIRSLWGHVSTLTNDLSAAMRRPVMLDGMNQLRGPDRMLAIRGLSEINRDPKSPAVAMALRYGIPKFTWLAHDLPDGVPAEYEEQFRTNWSGYTSQEAGWLIEPGA